MLQVRDIWKTYEGKPLLRGISFDLHAGETICLLGASGSGKSTLLRIIAGLEDAERGAVLWDGRDLTGVPAHQRGFGLMFQDYALFPHRSVAENVAFGLRMQGVPRAERDRRVREALELINMAEFGDRRVTDLSGGEQQRVALARAIAPQPRLLMFDEPLGALDRALKDQIEEEIRRLLHATGIPAIYVTHDQEEAFAVADRLVLLNQGEILQDGAPQVVVGQPASVWVAQFLGLNNLIAGRVISSQPPRAQTDLGVFAGRSEVELALEQKIHLLLRPDEAQVTSGPQTTNAISGTVEDCLFRGENFRVLVRAQNGQKFSFYLEQEAALGAAIHLQIPPEAVQMIPEQP